MEIEDAIIEQLKDNEILLFPEEAASLDKTSLDALEASYNYDMSKNSDILGDLSLNDYLEQVNPELLRQRSHSEKGLAENYLGPLSDGNNGVSEVARPLKSAAEKFNYNFTKLISSAKRAHKAYINLENNLDKKIEKTNQDTRGRMLGKGFNPKDRNPRI